MYGRTRLEDVPLTQTDPTDRLDDLDDAELLRRSRRSAHAFRIVYDRHVAGLDTFLRRRTGDPAVAFELTAETFAQAWISRGRFIDPGDGSARRWLFGIARNVLADSIRRRSLERRARDRLSLTAEPVEAAIDPSWLDGFDADLAAALADLPEGQRRAVEMRVVDGYGYAELATELDCSPVAARVRVHRGLAAMRRRLDPGPDR